MNTSLPLPRRAFLRGLGTVMALPYLESFGHKSFAAPLPVARAPLRMAFVYVPNGENMVDWTPTETGSNFELPRILQPLARVRNQLNIITGLAHQHAAAGPDGAGDHARASATFLTGVRAKKTQGADIRVGQSIDQFAAQQVGGLTKFASLELGTDRGQTAGNCDSGYSCAYSFNISWRNPSAPMPPEVDPRQAFDRLFSNGRAGETALARARRERRELSILDFVQEDAKGLQKQLGKTDQRKLDEYLSAVRDLERRLHKSDKLGMEVSDASRPAGVPAEFAQHVKLMFEVLTLAFRTDTTRIATFVLAHDGSNRAYPEIGVKEGHHELSHHGGAKDKKENISKINTFHMGLFAAWLEQMKHTPDGEGLSLLDNSMIVYGSGIEDGDAHRHSNLPVILAGGGGGTYKTGRHLKLAESVPMSNLFLSMTDRLGVKAERFGDSTGRLKELT